MANSGKITIVMVHGAWADGSSWKEVILGLDEKACESSQPRFL